MNNLKKMQSFYLTTLQIQTIHKAMRNQMHTKVMRVIIR